MADLRTRVVHLHAGQDRDRADNAGTRVVVVDWMPRASFEDLFVATWPELRRIATGFGQPGVAVAAVDRLRRRVAGSMCVAAKPGHASSAIIGRHGQCDLYLDGDPALSLRHLAVLVHPLRAGSGPSGPDVVYRVVDLRTGTAFTDEHDRRLEAVTAGGPMFLACGNYVLFFLVTGDPSAWPEGAADAWACIPERVYVGEQEAEPDRWKRRQGQRDGAGAASPNEAPAGAAPRARTGGERPAGKGRDGMAQGTRVVPAGAAGADRRSAVTIVRSQRGPTLASLELVGAGEQPRGALRLSAGASARTVVVGERALSDGVLLGRSERCDTHSVLDHENISRVHVLVIRIEDAVYAVDTASTNGTYLAGGDEVRIVRLDRGTELILGDDLARMEWRSP